MTGVIGLFVEKCRLVDHLKNGVSRSLVVLALKVRPRIDLVGNSMCRDEDGDGEIRAMKQAGT